MADITISVSHSSGVFGRFMERARAHFTARRAYAKTMSELVRMDDRQLDDLGISRADFQAIADGSYIDNR